MKCKLTIYNLLIFLITVAKPTTAKPTTVSTGGKYILVILINYGSSTNFIIVWCNLTNMLLILCLNRVRGQGFKLRGAIVPQ